MNTSEFTPSNQPQGTCRSRREEALSNLVGRRPSTICLLLGLLLFTPSAQAQVTIAVTNLPSRVGVDYYRAYINTADVGISGLLGTPGGPRRWDFSPPQRPDEVVRRTDIVAVSDGGHGAGFGAAAYAERVTNEGNGRQDWSYYRLVTNVARRYYGFYDAVANPDCPAKTFTTYDLPATVSYGQTWSRTVDFADCASGFNLAVHFTSQATVDAWGTVVLPGIGEVPALRLNEMNTYDVTLVDFGIPLSTTTYRNYYWLVRGIGKAVHILSPGYTGTSAPADFATAKTFLRTFESNTARDYLTPLTVSDLRLTRQGTWAVLDWRPEPNASGYRVETLGSLSSTNWQLVTEPSVNTWSNLLSVTETQRFFRVFSKP